MKIWLSIFGPAVAYEGGEGIVEGIKKYGANSLLIFTSLYHGYRLIQPRYLDNVIYTLETDRVFYKPDFTFYKDCILKPERSLDFSDYDFLEELVTPCRREGISLSALIPMFAGERIAQTNPQLAVSNLYDSHDRLFLCFNNPEARKYRLAMIRDIIERYEINALMLDKIPQSMLELNAFNGRFDPLMRIVGSFCFCKHCYKKAQEKGLDITAIKSRCKEIVRYSVRIPQYVKESLSNELLGDTEIPQLLIEEPLIYQMLQFRFASVIEFVKECRQLVKKLRPDIEFQAAFVPLMYIGHDRTSPRAWLAVQSYKKYAEVFDNIFCVVHWNNDVVRYETERAVTSVQGKCKITTSMRLYGATRPDEVGGLAEAALNGGSKDISFLGYDVAGKELLEALKNWVNSEVMTNDHEK